MRYAVVIEKANGNYSAYVPDLPGCVATGESVDIVETNIREAIRLHIDGLAQDRLPIPEPTSLAGYVEAQLNGDVDQRRTCRCDEVRITPPAPF